MIIRTAVVGTGKRETLKYFVTDSTCVTKFYRLASFKQCLLVNVISPHAEGLNQRYKLVSP